MDKAADAIRGELTDDELLLVDELRTAAGVLDGAAKAYTKAQERYRVALGKLGNLWGGGGASTG